MNNSLFALIGLSFFLGCGCWLFFLWGVQKGEFNDLERPKHRMLDDDEAPLPARSEGSPPLPVPPSEHELTLSHRPPEPPEAEAQAGAVPHR
ncbi:cbb3-type cytochrome oxidase assembly protein CcoS [Geomonas sp. Red69]|uniref:Cbb3-type cytochrome oxidase assembly protein CcoS n=1 Tax=Geomonas diazotrophica TaxID=2843197 RepID=A0ABX8JFF5_9BACT|nr:MULTISPECIES: cbb3-type cytochrome oxidase assembly protein CcoS [Geomonas]MBU5637781.1 cbb3-type cytochrome oxidase assembly protein CcoS [Geomonas diazotrophica]QWV96314.1 cbb3-type cytochrome oxidase assembly protein CcoS [Geomonas nitrogeniifigens]QXE85381.1 cbb3-type cytochrome oxidase assembly protein CcoS [Geomonas nitrogeniifigens]